MWITSLKIQHECIIGDRCKRFHVTTTGTPFSVFVKDDITYSPQMHTIDGDSKNIKSFINDLKKDKKVSNLEIEGNTIFLIEVQKKQKVTASIFATLGPKIIFVKPVFVDTQGFEYWEVASWKKEILIEFINGIKREVTKKISVLKIEQTKLKDIYFSHLMPNLTSHQKKALTLALEEGYYHWPKKTDFGKLSKLMDVSVATYREHLKRAEQKLMPDLIKSLK
jgi:predicted DNA binding protein